VNARKYTLIRSYNCGGKGIRTPDPLHAMQVLYQLSYTPKGSMMLAVWKSASLDGTQDQLGTLRGVRQIRRVVAREFNDFVAPLSHSFL
jgi:hypothetical protein